MLNGQSSIPSTSASLPDWTFSPVPAVEKAIQDMRRKYPALYPASLEHIHDFLANLGNPHRQLPFTFHVAGTNGKGSTLAFLQAVFESAGLNVHKYTSPHLVRFEERIILAGKMITPELLLDLIGECDRVAASGTVSFFEFFTALAFLAYARHPAESLLLETGLGGLYDATNVVGGSRIVSLLTPISYDHTHILGKLLPEIAMHKAGIIKPSCPVVVAPQMSSEVVDVFTRQAEAVGAPVCLYGREWGIMPGDAHFEYKSLHRHFTLPLPQLQGRHQLYNAGVALSALENSPYAFLMKREILERAMARVTWPGRLQRLTSGALAALLPTGWELWLDGAHNDAGAEVLMAQAQAWGKDKPLHLVTAMKKTKDVTGFYGRLLSYAATVQAVDVSRIEAPMTPAVMLCEKIGQMGYERARTAENLESALRSLVFQFTVPQRILVTGSLYLVGHALKDTSMAEG